MAKKEVAPDPPADVPVWFLTYSDVITLLMTFFILLLTFATDEPEKFDRLQVSLFGGGGATGIAGPSQEPLDLDSIAMRTRSAAGRMTKTGSEMPPVDQHASIQGVKQGLAGLADEQQRDMQALHTMTADLQRIVDDEGRPTALGEQMLTMVAQRMRAGPFDLTITVPPDAMTRGVRMAMYLADVKQVTAGRIAVGLAPAESAAKSLRLSITRRVEQAPE